MKKITIYTSKTCAYCKKLKEVFNAQDISFEEKDNTDNQEEWIRVQQVTGLAIFPTINHDNNYYLPGRDYNNPEQLISILKAVNKDTHSLDIKSKEAMKTLVYTINQGFGRIVQELKELKNVD